MRRWSPMRRAALAAVALVACRGGDAGKRPADSAAALQAVTPPAPASAAPSAQREAGPASIPPEVKATCAAAAGFWRRHDSTDVLVVDTLETPYMSDTAVDACVVVAWQAHGLRRDARAPVDTAAQRLGPALALERGAGSGWVPLYRFGADGPDGSSLAFQRGRVRCLVEQSWDGGDDSDSTYVPADWYKEQITCWLMPRGITVSDTSH